MTLRITEHEDKNGAMSVHYAAIVIGDIERTPEYERLCCYTYAMLFAAVTTVTAAPSRFRGALFRDTAFATPIRARSLFRASVAALLLRVDYDEC